MWSLCQTDSTAGRDSRLFIILFKAIMYFFASCFLKSRFISGPSLVSPPHMTNRQQIPLSENFRVKLEILWISGWKGLRSFRPRWGNAVFEIFKLMWFLIIMFHAPVIKINMLWIDNLLPPSRRSAAQQGARRCGCLVCRGSCSRENQSLWGQRLSQTQCCLHLQTPARCLSLCTECWCPEWEEPQDGAMKQCMTDWWSPGNVT